jgi:hypothetical protein
MSIQLPADEQIMHQLLESTRRSGRTQPRSIRRSTRWNAQALRNSITTLCQSDEAIFRLTHLPPLNY